MYGSSTGTTIAARVEAVSSADPHVIRYLARLSSTSYVRPGTRRLRLTPSNTPTIGLSIRTRIAAEHITNSVLPKLDNDGLIPKVGCRLRFGDVRGGLNIPST